MRPIYRQVRNGRSHHFFLLCGARWYVDPAFVRQETQAGRAYVFPIS